MPRPLGGPGTGLRREHHEEVGATRDHPRRGAAFGEPLGQRLRSAAPGALELLGRPLLGAAQPLPPVDADQHHARPPGKIALELPRPDQRLRLVTDSALQQIPDELRFDAPGRGDRSHAQTVAACSAATVSPRDGGDARLTPRYPHSSPPALTGATIVQPSPRSDGSRRSEGRSSRLERALRQPRTSSVNDSLPLSSLASTRSSSSMSTAVPPVSVRRERTTSRISEPSTAICVSCWWTRSARSASW